MKYSIILFLTLILTSCQKAEVHFDSIDALNVKAEKIHGKIISVNGYIRTDLEKTEESWSVAMLYPSENQALEATEYKGSEGVILFLRGENIHSCNNLYVNIRGKVGISDRQRTSIYPSDIITLNPAISEATSSEQSFRAIQCLSDEEL